LAFISANIVLVLLASMVFSISIICCDSTEDAVRIVNFFIYNPNHTSLQSLTIIYYVAVRLHSYNRYMFVTTVTYSTLAR
jgi:hypothetical protein